MLCRFFCSFGCLSAAEIIVSALTILLGSRRVTTTATRTCLSYIVPFHHLWSLSIRFSFVEIEKCGQDFGVWLISDVSVLLLLVVDVTLNPGPGARNLHLGAVNAHFLSNKAPAI